MNLAARGAPEQGGIISGANPIDFTKNDPIRLWVIQVAIIIIVSQFLGLILQRVKQPRVIAEVVGGVILGPTVMGRIPNFSSTIFPEESISYLSLTATMGLVLFLFLTALEVDVHIIKRNAKSSIAISFAGIILPFGMGAAISVPIYNEFVDQSVHFGYFLLFTGVAMSITAFPVLCRILTECKLLDTNVGVTVLSAGVGNDVVGWVLLALTVALVNVSGGLTALYILLATIGWTLFMMYPVKWVYRWLAVSTGSIENGTPTPFMMIVTLITVFVSAFMTDILGVHAIFGGFIAGLIIPHDGGYAISLVEKLEDLVTLLFIPIYFALSGLKTNLSLLDSAKLWGYIVLICTVAFVGKFAGCAFAARVFKFNWREASTIGVLMSCKGLVELIVLNIGLQAGILDSRLFSAFVVMALALTFVTTPATLALYPPKHRNSPVSTGFKSDTEVVMPRPPVTGDDEGFKSRLSVILDRIEHIPAIMTLTQLLHSSSSSVTLPSFPSPDEKAFGKCSDNPVILDALRLIELTDRTSAVMQSSEADEIMHRDALISILRTFGSLNSIPVSATLSVVTHESFPTSVAAHIRDKSSDLVVIPWNATADEQPAMTVYNPFEGIFGAGTSERPAHVVYSQFIRRVFATAPCDVGLFIDRGLFPVDQVAIPGQHIILPFFGGPDDRLALAFVVQLCANVSASATILKVRKVEPEHLTPTDTDETEIKPHGGFAANLTVMSSSGFPDTIYPVANTESRLESVNADNLLLSRYTAANRAIQTSAVESALTRITFEELVSATPLHSLIERANNEIAASRSPKRNILLVVGRGRRMVLDSHHTELRAIVQEHQSKVGGDVARTVGDVATAFMIGVKASMLVMQAALPSIQE